MASVCFFNSNVSSVNIFLFMCHQHEHGINFGVTFLGLMACQQYFRYIKVTYHIIVLPVRSVEARENVHCSIAFLIMVISMQTGINPGESECNIYRMVSDKIRNVEMVCFCTNIFMKQL